MRVGRLCHETHDGKRRVHPLVVVVIVEEGGRVQSRRNEILRKILNVDSLRLGNALLLLGEEQHGHEGDEARTDEENRPHEDDLLCGVTVTSHQRCDSPTSVRSLDGGERNIDLKMYQRWYKYEVVGLAASAKTSVACRTTQTTQTGARHPGCRGYLRPTWLRESWRGTPPR